MMYSKTERSENARSESMGMVMKPKTSIYLAEQGTPCEQGLALSGMMLYCNKL